MSAVVRMAFHYLPVHDSPAWQHGIGQSSIGQGISQQASVADVQEPEEAQEALAEFANEKAMPADSRTAALSAKALFFML